MSLLPVPAAPADTLVPLDRAKAYAGASRSDRTRAAYSSALGVFVTWCREAGAEPMPADPLTVAAYVAHLADTGRKPATIDLHVAAIAAAHRAGGFDNPAASETVKATIRGARRALGTRQTRKAPVTAETLRKMLRKIPDSPAGLRDRALILLGFAAALRRSELVALDVPDIERHRRGLMVRLRRSKTDQAGEGRSVAVPEGKLKIPAAVQAWLTASGITEGPVFRGADRGKLSPDRLTAGQFARILKARCAAAGLDPKAFGGHSPRRGFATSAGDEGSDLRLIATHMRHAKLETTAGYIEDADLFRKNAGSEFL